MKESLVLSALLILFILCGFLWAQDPEGELDYFYVVCGGDGYSGSGVSEVCFKLRFHSDNTAELNRPNSMVAFLRISGTNIESIDTTVAKAYAGSAVSGWDITTVRKLDDPDPTVSPFRMDYGAISFTSSITGDGLLVNICVNVNDTGTICIDTTSTESNRSFFNNEGISFYYAGWYGPFCCNIFLCQAISGDAVVNNTVNLTDLIYIVNYFAKGGPKPEPICRGDLTADGKVTIADIVYLAKYIFVGGPPGKKSGVCCL